MLIINVGLYTDGQKIFDFLLESINEYFYVQGKVVNGYLITYLALNTLWVHIPILIIIVTAHIFSSEFEMGTIRLLLTQPISRRHLFFSKLVSLVIFNLSFMLVVTLTALIPALILFGTGDLIVFIDGIQFIQEATFMGRLLNAVLFSTLAMIAFSCLSMFFSLLFKNTLTSILISLGILILFTLLQKFIFGIFSAWQPFMFTYHFAKWQLFFVNEIPVASIWNSVYFMTGMCIVLILVSLVKFEKMNISE
jgi:ABC-2 type transport system permease protein